LLSFEFYCFAQTTVDIPLSHAVSSFSQADFSAAATLTSTKTAFHASLVVGTIESGWAVAPAITNDGAQNATYFIDSNFDVEVSGNNHFTFALEFGWAVGSSNTHVLKKFRLLYTDMNRCALQSKIDSSDADVDSVFEVGEILTARSTAPTMLTFDADNVITAARYTAIQTFYINMKIDSKGLPKRRVTAFRLEAIEGLRFCRSTTDDLRFQTYLKR
jgi:hypothetical protein